MAAFWGRVTPRSYLKTLFSWSNDPVSTDVCLALITFSCIQGSQFISQVDDFYYSPPTWGRDTPPDPTRLSNISSVTSESLVTILLSTKPAAFGRGVQSHWTVTTLPIKLQCCLMKGLTSLLSWHPCQRASDPTSAFCSHAAVTAETRWRPPSALGYAHWWLYNLISHKSH